MAALKWRNATVASNSPGIHSGFIKPSRLRRMLGSSKPMKEILVNSSPKKLVLATGLVVAGLAIGAAGIYVGETDDAPGAALLGLVLMIGLIVLGIRTARRKG